MSENAAGALAVAILVVGCTPTPQPTGPPPCDETDDGADVAPLVDVPSPTGGTFGIDATPVTTHQYARFLDAVGEDVGGQPAACSWNSSFLPDPDCYGEDRNRFMQCGKMPQVCVDWCDARAYCAWVGKRLCGNPAGGPEPTEADHLSSQWVAACSAGGRNDYVFAASYDEEAALACNGNECNTRDVPGCLFVQEVDAHPMCESPVAEYGGVYGLAGNVDEWVDGCEGDAGPADACGVRGGSSLFGGAALACASRPAPARDFVGTRTGFRCCSL